MGQRRKHNANQRTSPKRSREHVTLMMQNVQCRIQRSTQYDYRLAPAYAPTVATLHRRSSARVITTLPLSRREMLLLTSCSEASGLREKKPERLHRAVPNERPA